MVKSCFAIGLALCWAHSAAQASTFNTGTEGWVSFQSSSTVTWSPTFGNPNGHIVLADSNDGWAYFKAPTSFQAPAPYGGVFMFDLRHTSSNGLPNVYKVRVGLAGNGLSIINEASLPSGNWTTFSFSLLESSGWRVFSNFNQNYFVGAPTISQAQLQLVLANLTGVYVAADYNDAVTPPQDVSYLDNERIVPSGIITLGDYIGNVSAHQIQTSLTSLSGTTTYLSTSVALTPSGAYTFIVPNTVPAGTYTLSADGSPFLKRKHNIGLPIGGGPVAVDFFLPNGDCDNSGEVDAADIDIVIAGFGLVAGAPGYSLSIDVDGSEEVDAADIDIVIANFGGVDN